MTKQGLWFQSPLLLGGHGEDGLSKLEFINCWDFIFWKMKVFTIFILSLQRPACLSANVFIFQKMKSQQFLNSNFESPSS